MVIIMNDSFKFPLKLYDKLHAHRKTLELFHYKVLVSFLKLAENTSTLIFSFEEILKESKVTKTELETALKKFDRNYIIRQHHEKGEVFYYLDEAFTNENSFLPRETKEESKKELTLFGITVETFVKLIEKADEQNFVETKIKDFFKEVIPKKYHDDIFIFLCYSNSFQLLYEMGLIMKYSNGYEINPIYFPEMSQESAALFFEKKPTVFLFRLFSGASGYTSKSCVQDLREKVLKETKKILEKKGKKS